jgi:hypothetical protein
MLYSFIIYCTNNASVCPAGIHSGACPEFCIAGLTLRLYIIYVLFKKLCYKNHVVSITVTLTLFETAVIYIQIQLHVL